MKHSGQIIQLPDKRFCIVYNEQPLIEAKGKIILHLVDENYNPQIGNNDKPRILIWDSNIYRQEMQNAKVIGYVD